jgi:hypothetical protein
VRTAATLAGYAHAVNRPVKTRQRPNQSLDEGDADVPAPSESLIGSCGAIEPLKDAQKTHHRKTPLQMPRAEGRQDDRLQWCELEHDRTHVRSSYALGEFAFPKNGNSRQVADQRGAMHGADRAPLIHAGLGW